MWNTIGASVFAAVLLWLVAERVLSRFQGMSGTTRSVRKELYKLRTDGNAQVTLWRAHPLSDHMVKEFAAAEGFRYSGKTNSYGSWMLEFTRPPTKMTIAV